MSWLFAIIASVAIWIIAFLATTGAPNMYAFLILFLVVPVFLIPLLVVFGVAAAVARAMGASLGGFCFSTVLPCLLQARVCG
jgi:hypothetical protein